MSQYLALMPASDLQQARMQLLPVQQEDEPQQGPPPQREAEEGEVPEAEEPPPAPDGAA